MPTIRENAPTVWQTMPICDGSRQPCDEMRHHTIAYADHQVLTAILGEFNKLQDNYGNWLANFTTELRQAQGGPTYVICVRVIYVKVALYL